MMKMSEAWWYIGFIIGNCIVHLTLKLVHIPQVSGERIPTLIAGLAAGVGLGFLMDRMQNTGRLPTERPPP